MRNSEKNGIYLKLPEKFNCPPVIIRSGGPYRHAENARVRTLNAEKIWQIQK
jgi:hypothetical protein